MAALPGSVMPSASASEFMVEAVPMVLQWPVEGAEDGHQLEELLRSRSRRPPASRARFQTMVPEPVRSPLCQPLSIGPTELRAMAGMLTVAAAISWAGVVLSQPVVSTTPSIG